MPPVPDAPITMRQLAMRLGLSTMTVSRALRNVAGVSPENHRRVHEAAKRWGYRPDPLLAVLNAYRHQRRALKSTEKIAFVTNFPTPDGWKRTPTFIRYFEGVQRRASQLGYDAEPFWLGDPELSAKRATQILSGRGVRGVIVGPLAEGNSVLPLDWSLFSGVAVGRSLTHPKLTTVSIHHGQALDLAWEEVWARGYRRIGLALTQAEDVRTLGLLRGAFLLQQSRLRQGRLPPLVTNGFSREAICAWAKTHRPDVLLTSESTHHQLLVEAVGAGDVPPLVHLNVLPETEGAGVDQQHDRVGEHAAALLHLKLLQRETGIPLPRDLLLIDGTWHEGRGRGRLPAKKIA